MAYPHATLNMIARGDGTSASYDVQSLPAPSEFGSGEPGSRSVTLTWEYSDSSQTGFEVQKSTDALEWTPIAFASASSRSRHISNLEPESTYYFRIRAVDSETPSRNSAWATPITVTTTEAPPVPSEFVQLAHYAEAEYPLEVYYPRPDNETNAWARHRKNHPDVPYRVPVICAFGAPPWFFELAEGPPGMTIGAFLPQLPSGKYDWEEPGDYGIVKWDNPTADGMPEGGWTITVRATDQELTVKTITWKLVVTTDGIIFVDPVNGDNSNAGTIDAPLLNTRGWYLDDPDDVTYSGYHVIYRQGQHYIYFDPNHSNPGRGHFLYTNKPMVHYGFPGEEVTWDNEVAQWNMGFMTTGRTSCPDFYLGQLTLENFEDSYSKKYIYYPNAGSSMTMDQPDSGCCRQTLFDIDVSGFVQTNGTDNNSGLMMAESTNPSGARRYYICGSRIRLRDSMSPGSSLNLALIFMGNAHKVAFEFCESTDSNMMFPYMCKGSGSSASVTYVKSINAGKSIWFNTVDSYERGAPTGYDDWRHVKISRDSHLTVEGIVTINQFPSSVPPTDIGSISIQRCTIASQTPSPTPHRYAMSSKADWPNTVRGCILTCNRPDPMYYQGGPDNYPDDPDWARTFQSGVVEVPLDENLDLTEGGAHLRGKFGAEIWGDA